MCSIPPTVSVAVKPRAIDEGAHVLPPPAGADAERLAAALGLSTTVADFLQRRGHTDVSALERFMAPRLSHLTPPDAMADREAAAQRLADAVQRGETVCVFGDYDCDGITSAAIVTGVLRALGGTAVPLLASRFDGGYGVSASACQRIKSSGATLLVTCDCGSSDHATLADVVKAGLDVVVIDHHLVPDEPLPAVAFLNPHRPECGFPFKHLASCGLALSVMAAVRAKLNRELDLRPWLDLVAIGTIADVVPLVGDNRPLVRTGLERLSRGGRPGVRALLELARVDATVALTGEDVAFRIAPRINAPGRLGPPDLALELLLADSVPAADAIAAQIEQLQVERRAIQDRMLREAIDEVEREGWAERRAIVIGREGWNHGIVGIVAGRLVGRFGKPVIVVGFDGQTGRGSVRGPAGSRLHDALSSVSGVLERFGGHQAAAGVEVRLEKLGELREAFDAAYESIQPGTASELDPALITRLAKDDDPRAVLRDLERLEPCGEGNPAPRLAVEADVVSARDVRGGHLKLELELAGARRMAAFAPAMGDRAGTLPSRVTVVGRLRRDAWRGGDAVELKADAIVD